MAGRDADYISSIAVQGASSLRIIGRHVVPVCIPVVIVRMTLTISNTILTAAAFGFSGSALSRRFRNGVPCFRKDVSSWSSIGGWSAHREGP